MIMGVGVLLAVSVPVVEVEEISEHYTTLYYGLSVAIAVLGGLVTTMGLMIGATLRGLIGAAHPEGESDLIEELAESER
jgi:ABC-type branched-subunit amino acid transport system permease subunit